MIAAEYIRPIISSGRLKMVGGEKGEPGCERKLAGAYCFGMKQSSSDALERGTALHKMAEIFQETGEIDDPEGEIGTIFRAGSHLLDTCGKMLVEWEHVGHLPDGSPYVAYIDGHSPDGGLTNLVVVQDLKTTGDSKYALTGDEDGEDDPSAAITGELSAYSLLLDKQAMFYGWILTCDRHWYCPPLPSDDHYGPKHWRIWDPVERGAKSARLRWLYFATRGVPRAWDASVFVTAAVCSAFMSSTLMPLVDKINALHQWHHANPRATLDEIDRNFNACSRRGRWCGVYERNACNFESLGTPALDLVQLKVRPKMTPQDRLAALRNRTPAAAGVLNTAPATTDEVAAKQSGDAFPKEKAANTSAVVGAAEPAIVASTPTAAVSSTPEQVSAETTPVVAEPAPKRTRGRPPKAAPGAGINPPEVVEALAKLTPTLAPAAPAAPAPAVVAAPAPAAPAVHQMAELGLGAFTTEQIVDFLVSRGYAVRLTRGGAA